MFDLIHYFRYKDKFQVYMGLCDSRPTQQKKKTVTSSKVHDVAEVGVIIEDVSEKSNNSRVFNQLVKNPDSFLLKRDVRKCFKDESNPAMAAKDSRVLRPENRQSA